MKKNWYVVTAVEDNILVLDAPCHIECCALTLYIPKKIRNRTVQMQAYGRRRFGMFRFHGCIAELQYDKFIREHWMMFTDSLAEVIPGTIAHLPGVTVEWINGYEIERILKSCNTGW